jgi:hypothetical protein
MKKHIIVMSLLLAANLSHAAVNGLSIHSRANCVNNESISWDWTKPRLFQTKSTHWTRDGKKSHEILTKSEVGRRSAAVHYGESVSGWVVDGVHDITDQDTKKIKTYITRAEGCNIYDGWWNW